MQDLHTALWTEGFVRARARTWWLTRGDTLPVSGTVIADLDPVDACGSPPLRVAMPPDRLERLPHGVRRCRPRTWARCLPSAWRAPGDLELRAAARANAQVLAYQWVPALALVSGRTRRLLLADAVGMGKTVQALLAIAEVHARVAAARSLIVAPAGLIGQWAEELSVRVHLVPCVLDGDTLARQTAAAETVPLIQPGEVCLVSIDMLRQPEVAALLERVTWQLVVVDEAHLLGPGTARAAGVHRVAAVACQAMLLTATPWSGDAHADRHLLTIGRHATDTDRLLIVARSASVLRRPPARTRVVWLQPTDDERRWLARLEAYVTRARTEAAAPPRDGLIAAGHLAAMLLRRRASSSRQAFIRTAERRLRLLHAVTESVTREPQRMLPFSQEAPEDECLPAPAWSDVRDERRCLQALTDDARRLDGPGVRVRWLVRWLRRVREPVLVFTEYLDTLRVIRSALDQTRQVTVLHGGQTSVQRALSVEQFTDGDADVLLATDAGSEGLNLQTRCRLVVHMDIPWSPRRLAQRNGRLDRLGQTRRVRALLPAVRGTHDERDARRLDARAAAARQRDVSPDAGLTVVASRRRERLAAVAVAAAQVIDAPPSDAGRHLRHGSLVSRVSPRRGAALRRRLGVPTCQALALVAVEAAAAHPMARPRRWLALACNHPWPEPPVGAHGSSADAFDRLLLHAVAPLRPVCQFIALASAMSSRWAALEARAREALPPLPDPDLFLHDTGTTCSDVMPPAETNAAARLRIADVRVISWHR